MFQSPTRLVPIQGRWMLASGTFVNNRGTPRLETLIAERRLGASQALRKQLLSKSDWPDVPGNTVIVYHSAKHGIFHGSRARK